MRTEMTANIGYDQFWETGGAVQPAQAATSLLEFAENVTKEHNGQFWAPRGPRFVLLSFMEARLGGADRVFVRRCVGI